MERWRTFLLQPGELHVRQGHGVGSIVLAWMLVVSNLMLLYQVIYIGFPDGQMVAGSSGASDEAGLPGSKDAGEEGRALPLLDWHISHCRSVRSRLDIIA